MKNILEINTIPSERSSLRAESRVIGIFSNLISALISIESFCRKFDLILSYIL